MGKIIDEKIAIIGIGRLGTSLARALREINCDVIALSDINRERAIECARICGDSTNYYQVHFLPRQVSMIFLTVPDDQIKAAADQLLDCPALDEETVVLHTSGAVTSDVLSALKPKTELLASVHPVQTFTGAEEDWKKLYEIYYGVEGHPKALTRLDKVLTKLRGKTFAIPAKYKSLYHLGCVFASNYLLTVIHAATRAFGKFGVEEETAIRILEPLIMASTDNASKAGVSGSATGPITRGDVGTIERHLRELEQHAPELVKAYKSLGLILVDVVKENNQLSAEEISRLENLLSDEARIEGQ